MLTFGLQQFNSLPLLSLQSNKICMSLILSLFEQDQRLALPHERGELYKCS